MKVRKQRREDSREDEYVAEERRKFEEAEAREQEIARQRHLRALDVAQGIRQQRDEAERRKLQEREDEREHESLLADEAERQVYLEKIEEVNRREQNQAHNHEVTLANERLIAYKEKQAEMERVEEERIKAQKYALDDAMEARSAADLQRRQTRQADIDRMIARQQQTLTELQAQRRDFDDQQYELQYQKEKKHVEELRARQTRLLDERRQDFLDSRAKLDQAEQRKKDKTPYPPDESVLREEEAIFEREQQREKALKDMAEFQRKQAAEKKEREDAEKERRKLEFRRQLELDTQRTVEAQEYARKMLLEAREQRKRKK
jgi:hypothetical protein